MGVGQHVELILDEKHLLSQYISARITCTIISFIIIASISIFSGAVKKWVTLNRIMSNVYYESISYIVAR